MFHQFQSKREEIKQDNTIDKSGEKNVNKLNQMDLQENKGEEEKDFIGEDLPFNRYQSIYNQFPLEYSKPYNDERIGYVELILFHRDKNDSLEPYPIHQVRLKREAEDDCGRRDLIQGSHRKKSIRFALRVGRNCKTEYAAPGRTYHLIEINQEPGYNYPIKFPPKDKLVYKKEFGEIKGTEDDPVYRIPILIEDVQKTKQEKEKFDPSKQETFTLNVKNVPGPTRENMGVWLVYMKDGKRWLSDRPVSSSSGQIKLKTYDRRKEEILGGSLGVYQRIGEPTSEDITKKNVLQLLKHRKNIQSLEVDLSGHSDFDGRKKEWIEKTIEVGSRIQSKTDKRVTPEKLDQWKISLILPGPQVKFGSRGILQSGTVKGIKVITSVVYIEDGKAKVDLIAPAGSYHLAAHGNLLKKNFSWPPE